MPQPEPQLRRASLVAPPTAQHTHAPNLPWPRPLVGIVWGVFLAVALAGTLIVPLSGLGFMGRKAGGTRFAVTTLLLHALWGLVIGLLYTGS